jgi:hypothetical protein
MAPLRKLRWRLGLRVCVLAAGVFFSAAALAIAANSTGTKKPTGTININVSPSSPRIGQNFKVFFSGKFANTGGRPAFWAWELVGKVPCAANASLEYSTTGRFPMDGGPNHYITGSPYSFQFTFQATAPKGTRTVCAYMYLHDEPSWDKPLLGPVTKFFAVNAAPSG